MNKMEITLYSGMSADGFKIRITDNEGMVIFKKDYMYGYDASHSWTNSKIKPFTTDIIVGLSDAYEVELEDIKVIPGIYVFSGKQMEQEEADRFYRKYMSGMEEN